MTLTALKISEDLVPLSEFKARTGEYVRRVGEHARPVVLTKHGKGVAVLMSVEQFERYEEALQADALRRALAESEADFEAGRFTNLDAFDREMRARLGRD